MDATLVVSDQETGKITLQNTPPFAVPSKHHFLTRYSEK